MPMLLGLLLMIAGLVFQHDNVAICGGLFFGFVFDHHGGSTDLAFLYIYTMSRHVKAYSGLRSSSALHRDFLLRAVLVG